MIWYESYDMDIKNIHRIYQINASASSGSCFIQGSHFPSMDFFSIYFYERRYPVYRYASCYNRYLNKKTFHKIQAAQVDDKHVVTK